MENGAKMSKLEEEFQFAKKLYKRNFKPGKAFEEQEKEWERKREERKNMTLYDTNTVRPYPRRRRSKRTKKMDDIIEQRQEQAKQEVNTIYLGLNDIRSWEQPPGNQILSSLTNEAELSMQAAQFPHFSTTRPRVPSGPLKAGRANINMQEAAATTASLNESTTELNLNHRSSDTENPNFFHIPQSTYTMATMGQTDTTSGQQSHQQRYPFHSAASHVAQDESKRMSHQAGANIFYRSQIPVHSSTLLKTPVQDPQELHSRNVSGAGTAPYHIVHPEQLRTMERNSRNDIETNSRNDVMTLYPEQNFRHFSANEISQSMAARTSQNATDKYSQNATDKYSQNATDKYSFNATHKGAAKRKSGEVHKQRHKQTLNLVLNDTNENSILIEPEKSKQNGEDRINVKECVKCQSKLQSSTSNFPSIDKDFLDAHRQEYVTDSENPKTHPAFYVNGKEKTFASGCDLCTKCSGETYYSGNTNLKNGEPIPSNLFQSGIPALCGKEKPKSNLSPDIILHKQYLVPKENFNTISTDSKCTQRQFLDCTSKITDPDPRLSRSSNVSFSQKLPPNLARQNIVNFENGVDTPEAMTMCFMTTAPNHGETSTYHNSQNYTSTMISKPSDPPCLDSKNIVSESSLIDSSFINLHEKELISSGPQIIEVRGNILNRPKKQLISNTKLHKNLIPKSIRDEEETSNGVFEMIDPKAICDGTLSHWSCKQVVCFLRETDCAKYADIFEEQDIDGKALILLTEDTLTRLLKIKIGPAIKIHRHVQNLKKALHNTEE